MSNIIKMRRDIGHNPYNYLSNAPGGVQAIASPNNHLIPTGKLHLFELSR